MADTSLTLSEYMFVNNDATGQVAFNADKAVRAVNARQMTPAELEEMIRTATGRYISPAKSVNGSPMTFDFSDTPTYTKTNPINSNETTVSRGKVTRPISTTINQTTGKVEASIVRGIGSKALTAISRVAAPVMAVQVAGFLGKTIDAAAYNANPQFWNDIGLSSVNPETWGNIIYSGSDVNDVSKAFLSFFLGIDPNTGETQGYMDANALAYMAYCMQLAGFFASGEESYYIDAEKAAELGIYPPREMAIYVTPVSPSTGEINILNVRYRVKSGSGVLVAYTNNPASTDYGIEFYTNDSNTVLQSYFRDSWYNKSLQFARYNDVRCYYYIIQSSVPFGTVTVPQVSYTPYFPTFRNAAYPQTVGYILYSDDSQHRESGGIEGVGTQDGATLPQLDGLTENDVLPALQQQYPDAFNDAISYPTVNPDGTVTNHQYVPVPFATAKDYTDPQPTTGEYTQTKTDINPATDPQTAIDYLTRLLQDLTTTDTPPNKPTDTGEGSTPVPVAPVGSASSLWKIYHPTQAQIDSFGAWLWSPAFVDQIAKVFNNPMESIIGLHKVYATPIDAGTSTIKVGYLDSQVPSAYIEQQYIDVDCGTVNMFELFGNALDYTNTTVKLYLPFVGIVPLSVSEVMRASISVDYGVDVLTGACLARVTVSRDGNDAILYQYAGNCAVQYPLSSGSYMGIVSSIIGVAGSIAATVASGGSVAPLALGAAGAAFGAHTSVQNSGSFSGNSGAMGGKVPYLIVERSQALLADDFAGFEGYPANQNVRIGDCSGYIECATAHILSVNATDDELTEINNLLLSGVIV